MKLIKKYFLFYAYRWFTILSPKQLSTLHFQDSFYCFLISMSSSSHWPRLFLPRAFRIKSSNLPCVLHAHRSICWSLRSLARSANHVAALYEVVSTITSLSFTYFPQYPDLIQAQTVFVTVSITRPKWHNTVNSVCSLYFATTYFGLLMWPSSRILTQVWKRRVLRFINSEYHTLVTWLLLQMVD